MPGPIARAFVDIIGRLRLEDNNELESGLRQSIRRIEGDLDRLEGAARRSGQEIERQLKGVRIDLNVREALRDLERVDRAAEGITGELHALRGQDIGLDTGRANKDINTLGDRLRKLTRDIKIVDGEEIDFNVEKATRHLNVLDGAIERLQADLRTIDSVRPDVDISDAASALARLERAVDEAISNMGRLGQTHVRVNVDDLEIDLLQRKVDRLDAERVDIPVDITGAEAASAQLERVKNQAGDFSRAFRRILAFGAIREVAQVVGQLFQAGVRAAGAIQLVEVSLNRFFAQTRDLGQTAGQFFNELRTLALETPFEFKDLAETSRRVLAMGVDAEDTVGIMKDLSDAVAAVGGGQGEIDGVVRALSQLSSKGRVDLQDFRQISENLPSLSRQMQFQGVIDEINELHPGMQATIADIEDLRKSGLITGKVLRDGVIRAISEIPGVAGAARAAARTLQGSLSNLADFATQEFASAFSGLGGIIADELNAAFGSITEGDALTPLASAIRDIIESFGRAGETNLPGILDGIADTAPEISALVQSVSDLVREALPAITNLSEGAFRSMTGLATLAESALAIFNSLPDGIQEAVGGFITLAAVIPGAGENLKAGISGVVTSFIALRAANATTQAAIAAGAGVGKVALLAEAAAAQSAALAAAAAQIALTAGLIIAVQLVTSTLAKGKQRADEFGDSISDATRSLGEFETFGEGALDFVNKFRIAGEGVNLGGLEKTLNGLTTGELKESFGATTEQIAGLVGELSRVGEVTDESFRKAVEAAGFSMDDMSEAGINAEFNIRALADQLAQATERTFDAAISSQEFVFVTDKQAAAIKRAASASGDYALGLEKLDEANQSGAKSEIAKAKARGATTAQIDDAIAANTEYVTGIDGTVKANIDYVAALQDVNEEIQKQDTLFQGLGEHYRGFTATFDGLVASVDRGNLGATFVDFALAIDKAGLSADDLNAIANELGNTLGQVLSGEELGKIATAFVTRVDELKTSLESVIPGIEDLQFEADNFSLDIFLDELNRIAEARINVSENIIKIVDAFGNFGREAVAALAENLDPEQFAIALEDIIARGPGAIEDVLLGFASTTTPVVEQIAKDFAAAGFSQEKIDEILGVDAFEAGVGELEAAVGSLDPVISDLVAKMARLDTAISGEDSPGRAKLLADDLRNLSAQLPSLTAPAQVVLPAVDATKTVASAEQAAEDVGAAFEKGVSALSADALERAFKKANTALAAFGSDAAAAMLTAADGSVASFALSFDDLSDEIHAEAVRATFAFNAFTSTAAHQAEAAAAAYNFAFVQTLALPEILRDELKRFAKIFPASNVGAVALAHGFSVGFNFGRGMSAGISASVGLAVVAALRMVSDVVQAAKVAAKIGSPSRVFVGIGEQIGAGLAQGINSSIPLIKNAGSKMLSAVGSGAGISGPSLLSGTAGPAAAMSRLAPSLATSSSGALSSAPTTSGGAVGAGEIHHHYHITAPTDDPEAIALRVAARVEERLSR